jgi:hypothetical protein
MYRCMHVHMYACECAHRCTQAQNIIMFTCLHLSNYECVCADACIRIHTYAYIYIYIFAHVHPCMCACTHGYMDTCRCFEKMMKMQTFIVSVGDDMAMHGLLQRMHDYIYIIMVGDTIIGPF